MGTACNGVCLQYILPTALHAPPCTKIFELTKYLSQSCYGHIKFYLKKTTKKSNFKIIKKLHFLKLLLFTLFRNLIP